MNSSSVEKVETFLELPHLVNESEFYFNSTRGFFCMNNGKGPGRPKCLNKVLSSPLFRGESAKLKLQRALNSVVAPPPQRMCNGYSYPRDHFHFRARDANIRQFRKN